MLCLLFYLSNLPPADGDAREMCYVAIWHLISKIEFTEHNGNFITLSWIDNIATRTACKGRLLTSSTHVIKRHQHQMIRDSKTLQPT